MKKLVLLLVIMLMAFVALNAQQLNVAMSPNTPEMISVWNETVNVPILKFNVTNPSSTGGIIAIDNLRFSFSGTFNPGAITNARIMLWNMQISETNNDPINQDFGPISVEIQPGITQELILVVDFADFNSPSTIAAGFSEANYISAAINGQTIPVIGDFPFYGSIFCSILPSLSVSLLQQMNQTFYPGQDDAELFRFAIQAAQETEIHQIAITNTNIHVPNNDSVQNIRLFIDEEQITSAPMFNNSGVATFLLDEVLDAQRIYHLRIVGDITPWAVTGEIIRLQIDNSDNIQAIGIVSGSACSIWGDFPISGNTHQIISEINPNEPMHYVSVQPSRNPSQVEDMSCYYMADTLYVYPGQMMQYSSSMQSVWNNHLENSVIGLNMNIALDTQFNTNELVVENPFHPTDGMLENIGITSFEDINPMVCRFAWASDSTTGINSCGLPAATISNHIAIGGTGNIWTYLGIYNFNPNIGIREESAFHNIHLISNNRIRGDIDGLNGFQNNDVLLGLQIFTNMQGWETQYNPENEFNISGSYTAIPHPTIFNTWAANANISGLGIGLPYDGTWPALVPLVYSNNNGSIPIQTDGNLVSVYWKNLNDTYQSETIMFTENSRAFRWTTSIEPTKISISRNDFIFQLPEGSILIDVKAAQIDYSPTSTDDPTIPVTTPVLNNAYPNPFNPETSISYSLPKSSTVTIEVYNAKGQLIRTLVNETRAAGNHNIVWNGTDNNNHPVSSGIYFYKMRSDSYVSTKKMVMMK